MYLGSESIEYSEEFWGGMMGFWPNSYWIFKGIGVGSNVYLRFLKEEAMTPGIPFDKYSKFLSLASFLNWKKQMVLFFSNSIFGGR